MVTVKWSVQPHAVGDEYKYSGSYNYRRGRGDFCRGGMTHYDGSNSRTFGDGSDKYCICEWYNK